MSGPRGSLISGVWIKHTLGNLCYSSNNYLAPTTWWNCLATVGTTVNKTYIDTIIMELIFHIGKHTIYLCGFLLLTRSSPQKDKAFLPQQVALSDLSNHYRVCWLRLGFIIQSAKPTKLVAQVVLRLNWRVVFDWLVDWLKGNFSYQLTKLLRTLF